MAAFGLYKPGQGYWVRVMTAAAIALLAFATAGWLMGQMTRLADGLPKTTFAGQLRGVSGETINAGDRVTLTTAATASTSATTLGTATVKQFDPVASMIKVDNFEPAVPGAIVESASVVTPASGGGWTGTVQGSFRGEPPVSPIVLQGVAAALSILGGAVLAWYFCGVKRGSVEFLIATDMEMKKVAWSTRKDILTSTWVVVGASFLIAAVLFGIDLVFQQFFRSINVLN